MRFSWRSVSHPRIVAHARDTICRYSASGAQPVRMLFQVRDRSVIKRRGFDIGLCVIHCRDMAILEGELREACSRVYCI